MSFAERSFEYAILFSLDFGMKAEQLHLELDEIITFLKSKKAATIGSGFE